MANSKLTGLLALVSRAIETLLEEQLSARLTHDAESLLAGLSFRADGAPVVDAKRAALVYERPYSGNYYVVRSNGLETASRSLWDRALAVADSAASRSFPVSRTAESAIVRGCQRLHQTRPERSPDGRGAAFEGDREDILELLGNLLDNACKWCRSRVSLDVSTGGGLVLVVEDDGPGCSDEQLDELTRRGFRADESKPGSKSRARVPGFCLFGILA